MRGETYDESCEVAVIEHPLPIGPNQPIHVHHGREVVCKKEAGEITLEPLLKSNHERTVGHEGRYKYVRSEDKTSDGRAIFRQEAVVA